MSSHLPGYCKIGLLVQLRVVYSFRINNLAKSAEFSDRVSGERWTFAPLVAIIMDHQNLLSLKNVVYKLLFPFVALIMLNASNYEKKRLCLIQLSCIGQTRVGVFFLRNLGVGDFRVNAKFPTM